MDNIIGSQFGQFTFGRSLFAGGIAIDLPTDSLPGVEWIIELTAPDGALVARLHNWYSAEVVEELNVAHILRFKYPIIDNITSLIDVPNIMVLKDLQGTRVIQRFIIKSVEDIQEEGIDMVLVVGASLMSQLYDTVVESYSTGSILKDVKTIVDDVFALGQVSSLHFPVINGMEDTLINEKQREIVEVKNVSIMRIIETLWDSIGFYMYVTPGGVFKWVRKMPSRLNSQPFIRWGPNLPRLSTIRDYNNVFTKVIVNGADILEDDPDPDFSGQVVTGKIQAIAQSDSAIIDKFGLRVHPVINKANLTTIGQAQELADAILKRVESPQRKVQAIAFDLSKAITNLDFSHTQLQIGMELTIDHPKFSSENFPKMIISSRSFDLANSLVQNITLTDPPDVNPYYRPKGSGGDGDITDDITNIEDLLDELDDKIDELTRLIISYWAYNDPSDLFPSPYDEAGECRAFWQLEIRKVLSQLPTENTLLDSNGRDLRCDAAPLIGWGMAQPDAYGVICNKLLAFLSTTFEADTVANLPEVGDAPNIAGDLVNLEEFEQYPPHFGYIKEGNEEGYYGLHISGWKKLGGGGFLVFDNMADALVGVATVSPPQLVFITTPFEGQSYFIVTSPGNLLSWTHFIQSTA